jgi:hypothetical protein
LRSSEKESSEARIFFRNFAKPQLYEGRPKGELCATVVQPQRVVQKASAASLLYNVLGLCVRAGNRSTKADIITKVQLKTTVEFCTSARLTQNPFCAPFFFVSLSKGRQYIVL